MNPITLYADETKWIDDWVKEYKYGIIMIYLPEPHLSEVTALRNRYFGANGDCDAHISLSVPVRRPVTQADLAEMERLLRDMKPFDIHYGPVVEKPTHKGVMLAVTEQEELRDLLGVVETSSIFEGAPVRKYPYLAHITVAEFVSWEQTYEIIEEIKGLPLTDSFELGYLSYAVPDQNLRFTERAWVYLGIEGKE